MRRFDVGAEQLEGVSKKVRDMIKTDQRPIRSVPDLVRSLKRETAALSIMSPAWNR